MEKLLASFEIIGNWSRELINSLDQENFASIRKDVIDDPQALIDTINSKTEYYTYADDNQILISKIIFEPSNKQLFLRLGFLPKHEESYNFISKKNEIGVSVFKLTNDIPELNTLQLISSFATREDLPAFLVAGDIVGQGFDGEPLIKNVKYIKEIELDFENITKTYLDSFYATFEKQKSYNSFNVFDTGISYYDKLYNNPISNFDDRLGFERSLTYYHAVLSKSHIVYESDGWIRFSIPNGKFAGFLITINKNNFETDSSFTFEIDNSSNIKVHKEDGNKIIHETISSDEFLDGSVFGDIFEEIHFSERVGR